MSPTRKFDRYMVQVGAGRNRKFVRLTDSERCAHFLGILSIAAQAPVRGYLLIEDHEAGAVEIANEASVRPAQARSALEKLKKIGILEWDSDLHAWHVHDWSELNPEPRKDATAAERQARFRARRKAAHNGSVTA